MAGHLALKGYTVNLYDRKPAHVQKIRRRKGIVLKGQLKGFGQLNLVTTNLQKAIDETDIIMVVVPANAHSDVAKACAPFLKDGQIIILNPGRTGGALEFRRYVSKNVLVAEAQTLLYACRSLKPGICQVHGIKKTVPIAAFPGYKTSHIVSLLKEAIPQFVASKNVLVTSLSNIGAVFHPTITILNSSRIDRGESFDFYYDGVTKAIANIVESVDYERIAIAKALGIKVLSAKTWLYQAYGSIGEDLYSTIHNTPSYKGIQAPITLDNRYIYEDIPTGLVPLTSLGQLTGVNTPTMNTLINLASIISKQNYLLSGRTIYDMGIDHLTPCSLANFAMNGDDRDEKETA